MTDCYGRELNADTLGTAAAENVRTALGSIARLRQLARNPFNDLRNVNAR
jgi:hypothetical protein